MDQAHMELTGTGLAHIKAYRGQSGRPGGWDQGDLKARQRAANGAGCFSPVGRGGDRVSGWGHI
jgi:hypothetical protein